MTKHRPSLEALASATLERDNVVTLQPPRRTSLPHVSVYISRRVQKEIKQVALTYDRRTHELYLEAINLLLAKYGRPAIAELDKGATS